VNDPRAVLTYIYAVVLAGVTHEVSVTRRHVGTAYAKNGNVGNPTQYYVWQATVDGGPAGGVYGSRWEAYDAAVARLDGRNMADRRGRDGQWMKQWLRNFRLVQAEMKQNLVRTVKAA